jgi:exo-poly-alpha-galacturonosidase
MKKIHAASIFSLFLLVIFSIVKSSPSAQAGETIAPPTNLQSPAASADDTSIVLIWNKPVDDSDISSYNIYMDDKQIGSTKTAETPLKDPMEAFYAAPENANAVKISVHNYRVTGLNPENKHKFSVKSVSQNGKESAASNEIEQSTSPKKKTFLITDYGAVGDRNTLNTKAIQQAIDACTPGGKVLIPAGFFKTGPLWLKSDMTLEISPEATLLASENADEYSYIDTSGELRFYALINSKDAKNIRITGAGCIDGNGWMQSSSTDDGLPVFLKAKNTIKAGQPALMHTFNIGILAKSSVQKAMDSGLSFKQAYPRRPCLITLKDSSDIYLADFTLRNPANHAIGIYGSKSAALNRIRVETYDANNGDGLNFADSDGLLVFNSLFSTGDDDINFSAGQGLNDQQKASTKNIWIFNNYIRRGHGAIVAGSHTAAWIENILAEDNLIERTQTGLRCKTNQTTGGGARNIIFRDNALKDIEKQAFVFTSNYEDPNAANAYPPADAPGVFHDITIQNCSIDKTGEAAIEAIGIPSASHFGLKFENLRFSHVDTIHLDYIYGSQFKNVTFADPANINRNIQHASGIVIDGKSSDY